MAIIQERQLDVKHKPSNLELQGRALPLRAVIMAPDGSQILQVRQGTSTISSSSTTTRSSTSTSRSSTSSSRSTSSGTRSSSATRSSNTSMPTASSTSSHRLPITPVRSSTISATSSPTAVGASGGASKGIPAYVPALATVFSVLGVLIFGLLIFFFCRRRKKAALAEVEAQKREKWGVRWRQRGQDGSDGGSPPYMGYMGAAGNRSSSDSTFLSPRDNSPNSHTQMLDAPSSPTGWGPFHITPYRLSFTVRLPSKFRPSNVKQATISGPKELVLPSKPSRFYDRRSPPMGGSQVSIFTRPSYRSRRTDTTPPPSYNSRNLSSRTLATAATNGTRSTPSRTPPTLPPVLTGPVLNITAAPQSAESPSPYPAIPSAVLTPLSQVVTFPASNLPLPRQMVVISTFTPALSDELSIQVGQTLKMVEEYDDGWCLVEREGLNGRQPEQGAVPRFCLDEVLPEDPGTAPMSVRSGMTPHTAGPLPSPRRTGSLRHRRESKPNRI